MNAYTNTQVNTFGVWNRLGKSCGDRDTRKTEIKELGNLWQRQWEEMLLSTEKRGFQQHRKLTVEREW